MSGKTKETGISPENQAVLNDRAFFGHPKGVGALAFGNLCNSFAWAAVYAVWCGIKKVDILFSRIS